jgi:hypothetical protein
MDETADNLARSNGSSLSKISFTKVGSMQAIIEDSIFQSDKDVAKETSEPDLYKIPFHAESSLVDSHSTSLEADGFMTRLTVNPSKESRSKSSNLVTELKPDIYIQQDISPFAKDLKKSNSSGLTPRRPSLQSIHKQAAIVENFKQDLKPCSNVSNRISMQSVISKRASIQSIHKQSENSISREPYKSGLMTGGKFVFASREATIIFATTSVISP